MGTQGQQRERRRQASWSLGTDCLEHPARSLFESGINWGRVVALLGFGYRLALHVYHRGLTGFLGQVTRFIVDFMLQNCIARWIAQRGGWVSAPPIPSTPLPSPPSPEFSQIQAACL